MTLEEQFLTKQKFSKLIEETVKSDKLTYMEAIISVCEKYFIDIEDTKKFISASIKDKVEAEARELNYLPRLNTLPFDDI